MDSSAQVDLAALGQELRQVTSNVDRVRCVRAAVDVLRKPSFATRSNWHPYGFLQVKILEDKSGGVRFHIWPESNRVRQVPDWPVHNHRYTLDSFVLLGEIANESYAVEASVSAIDDSHVLYEAIYEEKRSLLRRTKQNVSISIAAKEAYITGDHYRIPEQEFHVSTAAEGFVTTLVFTTSCSNSSSFVVGERNQAEELIFERRVCDESTYCSLLNCLAERLGA